MILGDILALAMVGTWLLALDEYKAKLLAWGRTTFTLLAITGVATIIISYGLCCTNLSVKGFSAI